MNTQTQISNRKDNPLVELNSQLALRADQFKAVLPSHITVEKFQRTVMTAVQSDPDLLKADRKSLMLACMKAAQDNLLPDKRESALVIFNNRQKDPQGKWVTVKEVVYMPMVYGLRKKILQSGEVTDITTAVVYRQEIESGKFIYEEGTERMLRHKPELDPDFSPTDDDIAAAYSVATFKDGTKSFEVMRRSEINKIRQVSKTGAVGRTDYQGKPIDPKGPWVDWFSEQARKTALRRHSKSLPMSGDIIDIERNDEDEYARSSVAVLSATEPDEPTRLPSPEELDANAQGYDPQTGEVDEQQDQQDGQDEREVDAEAEREAAKMQGQADDDNDVREQLENSEGQAAEETEQPSEGSTINFDDQADLIIEELKSRETVPDVNSYMFSDAVRDILKQAPDAVIDRVEKAKRGRISEIQNQGQKK